jgi:hypothetical protein
LRQIPDLHLAAPRESAFAQTANRTKMFHVKHFWYDGAPKPDKSSNKARAKPLDFYEAGDDGEAFLVGFERPLKVALRLA